MAKKSWDRARWGGDAPRVRVRCCLLCIYMPAIDRPRCLLCIHMLSAVYIHAGD